MFNITELTPILEGNQLEDENNVSSYSEEKNKEETDLEQKKMGYRLKIVTLKMKVLLFIHHKNLKL